MKRREFSSSAIAIGTGVCSAAAASETRWSQPFKLKYAPRLGMFVRSAGDDPIDQLQFMADQGFRAVEDPGIGDRAALTQKRIARAASRLGLEMGAVAAHDDSTRVTFASANPEVRGHHGARPLR